MTDIERAIEYLYRRMERGLINNDTEQETYEIAISALEKQIPKKPIRVSNNRTDGCPECKTEYYEAFKYCPGCGQRMDWSVEE